MNTLNSVALPTIIGLDYDGTVTRDVATWLKIIQLFKAAGHTVYIVTMRYPSEQSHPPAQAMDQDVINAVDEVIFTSRGPKAVAMSKRGIAVNVWIDDNPQAVFLSARQIWGHVTAEGHVTIPEDPSTHPRVAQPLQVVNGE